ncbi:MAG: glycosyltransferase [Deltaproteobacteria bacterium]|nr:glycosyltransferase [Deltaproteobacteria bacterium]
MSNNDWWYHNPTSPIQIAKEFAKDHKVLFVNSISFGMPSQKERDFFAKLTRKVKSYITFFRKVGTSLHVLSPVSIPSFSNPGIVALNKLILQWQIELGLRMAGLEHPICIVANPMFQSGGVPSNCFKLIYFVTDKYDSKKLPNKEAVIEADRKMAKRADVIVCVSHALFKYYNGMYGKTKVITHGVNYEHFSRANENTLNWPDDMKDLRKPIVGFMGAIDAKTVDPDLLVYLLKKNSKKTFIFVGNLSNNISYLNEYENAYFLGQKHFNELPRYLSKFDVALMPFNNSEWIRYCNPIKLKEYLAAGLPVVSINIKEAEPYGDIMYLASNYEEFNKLLNIAIKEDSIQLRRDRQERMSGETWAEKVNQLKELIN